MSNKDRLQEHQSDTTIYVLFSVSVSILSEHAAFAFLATLTTHRSAGTGHKDRWIQFHTVPFPVTVSRRYDVLSAVIHLSTRSNAYTSAYIRHYSTSGPAALIHLFL